MHRGGILRAKEVGRSLLYTICSFHLVTNYLVDVTLTQGPSMSPTIDDTSTLALYIRPWLLRTLRGSPAFPYREGDIVIGVSPTDASRRICKRICATEFKRLGAVTVPPGHVWLEGDNKENSLDSRYYGAVSSHLLIGRVFMVTSLRQGARFV